MIHTAHPLIFTPDSPSTEHTGDPDEVNTVDVHRQFCEWPEGTPLEDHGPLCESATGLLEYLPDPRGYLHEVTVGRVSSYLIGTYDAFTIRRHWDSRTLIRLGIDLPSTGDPSVDAEQGLCLTSGQARQLAAVLIDQADRVDGIRPNH